MFDSKTKTSDADFLQGFKLRFSQRAGFALKGDLFGIIPAHVAVEPLNKVVKLFFADVRRRAASKISKPEASALKRRSPAVNFVFSYQGIEIVLDLSRILIRINLEIAEFATFTAKRDVQIKPQRVIYSRRLI